MQTLSIPRPYRRQPFLRPLRDATYWRRRRRAQAKHLAFSFPSSNECPRKRGTKGPQALILLPTRELAMQVIEVWRHLTQTQGTAVLVCGGLAEGPQLAAIRRGPRLIVATPGRLEDYLSRRLVNLSGIKMLVLDEVDRMLDMGFEPAIRRIAQVLPRDRQTLCYAATLSPEIREVASNYLRDPVRIEIGSVLKPSPNVELRSFEVPADKKQELLEHLLGANKGSFLVFVRTKHGADRVARRLSWAGHSATQIHGDRSQAQRSTALRSFAQGHHRVLVATDVAARGIDVAASRTSSTSTCPGKQRIMCTAWGERAGPKPRRGVDLCLSRRGASVPEDGARPGYYDQEISRPPQHRSARAGGLRRPACVTSSQRQ